MDIPFREFAEKLDPISEIPGKHRKYRSRQVCEWVFHQRAISFDQMTNLPQGFRHSLSENYRIRGLRISKKARSTEDGTTKYTFETRDSKFFSAVLLPHHRYHSLCISSQVGCAWECRFCASGLVPFSRNLSAGEICDQIFLVEQESGQRIKNILFMGMGEPLANYQGTLNSIRWFTASQGFQLNPSRIVLSTTGLAAQIKKLGDEKLNVNLALSLHAPSDALRKKIMPKSSKLPIRDILSACKYYQSKNDSSLTIEYILLKGINDQPQTALQLSTLLRSIRFARAPKINLIPYNPVPSLRYEPSDPLTTESFFRNLKKDRLNVHTRKPQGQDLEAACGQLL